MSAFIFARVAVSDSLVDPVFTVILLSLYTFTNKYRHYHLLKLCTNIILMLSFLGHGTVPLHTELIYVTLSIKNTDARYLCGS